MFHLKNTLLTLCARASRPFSHPPSERFLIVSTTGLGDSLWGTPALRALRSAYPNSYIALLTSPIGKEVFETNPHIDELFCINTPLKSLWSLRRRKISTALIFHSSQRITLPLCHLIGAHTIIGTKGLNKGLDNLLHLALPNKPIHEIERRLDLIRALNIPCQKDPYLELYLTPEDENSVKTLLSPNILCIHPGAQDRFKCWPLESFAAVAKKLQKDLSCTVIIAGGFKEKTLAKTLASHIPESKTFIGYSVRAYAALLKHARLFITNDTGPMHIACATRTPTIALFGPTDPLLCGPINAPHMHILSTQTTCTPCLRKKCQDPFCMLQINPNSVYNLATRMYTQNDSKAGIYTIRKK